MIGMFLVILRKCCFELGIYDTSSFILVAKFCAELLEMKSWLNYWRELYGFWFTLDVKPLLLV